MVLFWYKIDHCVKRAVGAECLKRRIILWAIFMQKGNWNNGSQPHCKADFIITKTKDGGNNTTTYHTPYTYHTSIVLYKIVRKLKKWIFWTTGTLNLYNLGNFAFHKNFLGFLKSTLKIHVSGKMCSETHIVQCKKRKLFVIFDWGNWHF